MGITACSNVEPTVLIILPKNPSCRCVSASQEERKNIFRCVRGLLPPTAIPTCPGVLPDKSVEPVKFRACEVSHLTDGFRPTFFKELVKDWGFVTDGDLGYRYIEQLVAILFHGFKCAVRTELELFKDSSQLWIDPIWVSMCWKLF